MINPARAMINLGRAIILEPVNRVPGVTTALMVR